VTDLITKPTSSLGGGLTGGLFVSPILAGLRALFGGGNPEPLPEIVKYSKPDPVSLDLGLLDSGATLTSVSRGAGDQPRVTPAITVNVNAIDSRSFSDHSESIARAVREAMLNSGALSDVVGEL
jgi:hypothetical protein